MLERLTTRQTERPTHKAIIPVRQNLEAGCVPTSIAMVFSGFGIELGEQTLVDRYFQTAKLPATDSRRGVSNTDTIKGILQIINDLGLKESLQLDVFISELYEYTKSPEERYLVRAKPKALKRSGKRFERGTETRGFYELLEQLVKTGEIGVYTANARIMKLSKSSGWPTEVTEATLKGFYNEFSGFISKGHIVGPHGGLTLHTRVLDGTRTERLSYRDEEKGYVVIDPRGENYAVSLDSLVRIDDFGVRGDIFDYLFRVSVKEKDLAPQQHFFQKFVSKLRP